MFSGVMELTLNFGDKGWDSSEFHTDLLDGQEDFLDFPDDEYSDALSQVASTDNSIIIEEREDKPTARSVSSTTLTDSTTPFSEDLPSDLTSSFSTSSSSTSSSTSSSSETSSSDSDDETTPVFQALNVQDPENKATEIHNEILVKLKEQLRSFAQNALLG